MPPTETLALRSIGWAVIMSCGCDETGPHSRGAARNKTYLAAGEHSHYVIVQRLMVKLSLRVVARGDRGLWLNQSPE